MLRKGYYFFLARYVLEATKRLKCEESWRLCMKTKKGPFFQRLFEARALRLDLEDLEQICRVTFVLSLITAL